MFRISPPAPLWRTLTSRRPVQKVHVRRFLGITSKAKKPRATLLRWALVAGGVYYYNTSDLFAEKPDEDFTDNEKSIPSKAAIDRITIGEILKRKEEHKSLKLAEAQGSLEATKPDAGQAHQVVDDTPKSKSGEKASEEAENPAGQEGAFDPETGTINWDCPCLGGMAHGPCGEEFKDAFSCFVHSKEEPKGVECIDRFKTMQNCFRIYPEIYGAELEDDVSDSESEGEKALEKGEEALHVADQLPQSPQGTAGLTDSTLQLNQEADKGNKENNTAQDKDGLSPS